MEPAAALLEHLAAARREGIDFTQAWPEAVSQALSDVHGEELRDWAAALNDTRAEWQAGWERRPPTRRAELALLAVAHDEDREPMPEHDGRYCARCDAPIPPDRGRRGAPARYCSGRCRRRASDRRLVVAA